MSGCCILFFVLVGSVLVQSFVSNSNAFLWKSLSSFQPHFLTASNYQGERTLYEVLRSSPDATRQELKQQYIKLAKELHPDANINSQKSSDDNDESFVEVANAWKILSDPVERRRYDRSLSANKFVDDVGRTASILSRTAAPHVKNMYEKVARPFFRRTSVTTSAAIQAAVQDLSSENVTRKNPIVALESALTAGSIAGRDIRKEEIIEKIQELETRILDEVQVVDDMKNKLRQVSIKKVHFTLKMQVPNASISSEEAMIYLESLKRKQPSSAKRKKRSEKKEIKEINSLEILETSYQNKQAENKAFLVQLNMENAALRDVLKREKAAKLAEVKAKKALESAQKLVKSCKQEINKTEKIISSIQNKFNKSEADVQKLKIGLEKQQYEVFHVLSLKQQDIFNDKCYNNTISSYQTNNNMTNVTSSNDLLLEEITLNEYKSLKKEENYLRDESKRLEDKVIRIQSRAARLKAEIKNYEN